MLTATFRAFACWTSTSSIQNITRIPLKSNIDVVYSVLSHFWQTNTSNINHVHGYAILNRLDMSTAKQIFSRLINSLEIICRKPIMYGSIYEIAHYMTIVKVQLKFTLNTLDIFPTIRWNIIKWHVCNCTWCITARWLLI